MARRGDPAGPPSPAEGSDLEKKPDPHPCTIRISGGLGGGVLRDEITGASAGVSNF